MTQWGKALSAEAYSTCLKPQYKIMKFEDTLLNDNVLDALWDMHFDEMTPIQEQCIPQILDGRDLIGVAQTGTGKTAAYLLPILSKLDDGGYPKDKINCVIMSPTRELAQQIDQAMQGFAYYLDGVSSVAVYGGNDGNRYDQELKSLRLGADVIIATPGRLISHMQMGNVDFSHVSFFVLDEADRMLDMGFSDDILTIARQLPPTVQTVMFSATMPPKIEELAKTLLKNPVEVKIAVSKPAEKIRQSAYVCYEPQKMAIVKSLFKNGDLKRVIIFSDKKSKVKEINRAFVRMHINSGEMHSDLSQAERDDIMFKFKSGQIDVLVATDIVARGIDIDDIAMVINYDVPHDVEDYVHRIGRTARADRDGIAITFVSEVDIYYFQQIEKFLEKAVEKVPLAEELGAVPEYKAVAKPGKGKSAKSRRRDARDQQSHKDKKSRNRQNKQRAEKAEGQSRKSEQKQERGQEQEKRQGGQQRQPKPRKEQQPKKEQQPTQQQGGGKEKQGQDAQPRNNRRRQQSQAGKGDKSKQQPAQPKQQSAQPKQGEAAQSKPAAAKKSRKRGRGRGGKATAQPEVRTTKYDIREEFLLPKKKKDNKIARLVKTPLKWLHIIK